MSAQTDIKEIREAIRFIPMQIEELRSDIARFYALTLEELTLEKKSAKSLRPLLSSLPPGSPYWKIGEEKASQIQAR